MTDQQMTTTDGGRQMTAAERQNRKDAMELRALVADRISRVEQSMETHIGPWLKQANISPDVFLSSYRLAMAKNPAIAKCTPVSLLLALMDSAKIGLVPDGKKAAIVPYKGEATFIPMRDGIVDVMGRAGYRVSAQVVYEGEDDPEILDYDLGSDPFVRFKPPLDRDDTSKVIAAFAIVTEKDGNGKWVELCSEKDLIKIRRMSKTDKVRKEWPGEMDRKAPLRRVAKFLPSDPHLDILNAIEAKAYLKAPPPEPTAARRLSDAELLDDAASVGTGIIEGEAVEPAQDEEENLSTIHRFTEMLATAPDGETLEERAAWVISQTDYDTLPAEEKAIFEMTLRMQREEFGVPAEAPIEDGAFDPLLVIGSTDPRARAAMFGEVGEVVVTEHKSGRKKPFATGAEFQAFMLETLSGGDDKSLFMWWQANADSMAAADTIWPEHAERVREIAKGKGLGE